MRDRAETRLKSLLESLSLLAFVAMVVSLWMWNPPLWGPLLSLPLAACLPWMLARRVRAFVLGGALALPYLSYAIVEIVIARADRPAGAVAMLAAGAIFMALLSPVTRQLGREIRSQ